MDGETHPVKRKVGGSSKLLTVHCAGLAAAFGMKGHYRCDCKERMVWIPAK